MVVITIIGILAAIAIPQFSIHRQRGFDARAKTDLRNLVTAEEAYFATNETYTTSTAALPGFRQSSGITIGGPKATRTAFTATAKHLTGTKIFTFDSAVGRMTSG